MAERGHSYWFVQPGAEQQRCGTQIHEDYTEPTNFRVEGLVAEGDFVIAVGKINLKNAEGVPVDYSYCDVWRLRDGKLHELKGLW